jgi:hypothetical protein
VLLWERYGRAVNGGLKFSPNNFQINGHTATNTWFYFALLRLFIVPSILLVLLLYRRRLFATGKRPVAIPRAVSWASVGLAAFFFAWQLLYWIWPRG